MKLIGLLISMLMLASSPQHSARQVEIRKTDPYNGDTLVFATTFDNEGYPNYLVESCGRATFHNLLTFGEKCMPDDGYVLLKLRRVSNNFEDHINTKLILLKPHESAVIED